MNTVLRRGTRRVAAAGLIACFGALLGAPDARADATPLTGTFALSGFSDSQSCTPASLNGIESAGGTITITGQPNGQFSGSGSDGDTTFQVQGELFTNNSFIIQIQFQDPGESGTLSGSGTFTPDNTLHLTASGSSTSCSIEFVDVTLTRIGGSTITSSAAPTLVNAPQQLSTSARFFSNTITSQLRSRQGGAGSSLRKLASNGVMATGVAAGDGAGMPIAAWGGFTYIDSKNDFSSTASSTDTRTFIGGIDVQPNKDWVVGVAMGVERTNIDNFFNPAGAGEQDTTAITLAPYIGGLLTDWLSIDATVGYSDVQTDQFRASAAGPITSDVESHRLFASANVLATHAFGNFLASGQFGMLWAKQHDNSFVESNGGRFGSVTNSLGRFLLGGEVAYAAGAFEPYVNLLYQYDFSKTRQTFAPGVATPKNDDSDLLIGLGLRYYHKDGVSASVQYTTLKGRRDINEDTYAAQVRWEF